MSVSDLSALSGVPRQNGPGRRKPDFALATVEAAPVDWDDSMVIVAYGESQEWPDVVKPHHWSPRGTSLPVAGDSCLVHYDSLGDPWVTQWAGPNALPAPTPPYVPPVGAQAVAGDLFASAAASRAGCLLCDGTSYTLSAHPELATLAAACPGLVTAGVLKVPDMQGRVPVGAGTGAGLSARALGSAGGAETIQLTAAQSGLPAHSHTYPDHPNFSGFGQTSAIQGNAVGSLSSGSTSVVPAADATQAHSNMQPYSVVNWFIKT